MGLPATSEQRRPVARLYLLTPPVDDPRGIEAALASALDAADVAAVLLRLAAADDRTLINRIKALAKVVQDKGAALLLDDHAGIAAHAGADGAHLPDLAAFQAARATLQPARIAGCGGLASRHDAMVAAENGADYVMFGEPPVDATRPPALGAIVERVSWWAEVFEIPCVAFAQTLDDVGPLAGAGADFIALGDFVFRDSRGSAAAVAAAAERIAAAAVPEIAGTEAAR